VELLGNLGRSGKNSVKGINSGRLPISRGPAKERQSSVLVNTKLDSLKLGTTKMELRELPKTDAFAKLMVPPTGRATSKWQGGQSIWTSKTPGGGPRPAKALGFLPRQANDATWAR
jgi:hypothetical protein